MDKKPEQENQQEQKPDETKKVKACYACGLEFTGHGKVCSSSCRREFYS